MDSMISIYRKKYCSNVYPRIQRVNSILRVYTETEKTENSQGMKFLSEKTGKSQRNFFKNLLTVFSQLVNFRIIFDSL